MVWFSLGPTLAVAVLAGFWALCRRQALLVFTSGLLLNVAGVLVWWYRPSASATELWCIQTLCLALAATVWTFLDLADLGGVPHVAFAARPFVFAHLAIQLAITMLAFRTACGLTQAMLDRPPMMLRPLDWWALLVAFSAVVLGLWDRAARFSLPGLYALALIALGMAQTHRGFSPGQFFLWASECEIAGFVLVAALCGWLLPRFKLLAAKLRIPHEANRWSVRWFPCVQAVLALVTAGLAIWIAIDRSFDGIGKGVALFGLTGRSAACPVALMLLGTTILMAWQSRGPKRASWQYAALITGLLFTTSIGWASLDATSPAIWQHRTFNLLISTSMMTLLTGLGLARVLPRHTDWIQRGRRAMPVFGSLALILLAIVIVQRWR